MLVAPPLIFSLVLQLTTACMSDEDGSLKQKAFYYNHCKCREYVDVYATCYYVGCERFPRWFQTSLKCFVLQDMGIKKVYAGDFDNLTHITGLHIETNKYLMRIQPGAFKDLEEVVTLSISYNPNLVTLDQHVFKGLLNLETLMLIRNGFNDFKDFSASFKASYMPKLTTIHLKELNSPTVDKDTFINLNGSDIRNLFFDDSQIQFIHPDALTIFRNLSNLSVSETLMTNENLIDVLNIFIDEEIPLTSLNLKGWGFKSKVPDELFTVIAKTTIKELILNRNLFHTIDENSFPKMPNIEKLSLERSMVTAVAEKAFSNFPRLQQIRLKHNKLISVPVGVLLPTIQELDISGNTKRGLSYFSIEDYNFVNATSMKKLDFSNNNLRRIYNQTLSGLMNLRLLNLYHCNIMVISENSFVDLFNLEYLDLGDNRFPQRTFTKGIFNGLTNLKYLSLESCKIDSFHSNDIFSYLISLESLNLKNNFLTEITPEFILSLSTLKVLNIADNKIKMWHERVFKGTKVENLTVSRNTFSYLTEAIMMDISHFKMIDISKNPFLCDCASIVESFNCLSRTKIKYVLSIINKTSTYCLLPETAENTTIVSYYQDNYKLCDRDKIVTLLDYLIPSSICLVVILVIVVLSYMYRWHIRYWIFLTKLAISKRMQFTKRESERGHTNYLYDAFVSYSSDDRNFVIRLVSMLENYEPFLKLCVYERDFEIGTIISESVLECLSRSRKTLLIISNSYIKSQWCIWEAQVAENHRLFFENEHGECVDDSLIMIKLGNISSNNISPMLKYLMKTRIYLQWDSADCKQKQFWEKLRNALAPALNDTEEKPIDMKL